MLSTVLWKTLAILGRVSPGCTTRKAPSTGSMLSTCPTDSVFISLFVFTTGIGHSSPRQSRSLSSWIAVIR